MQTNLNITLAEYKQINTYRPKIGDFVIWHGWFTHYYGIVNGIDNNKIRIVKAGMPILLLSMDPDDINKNLTIVSVNKIKGSRGAYAVYQNGIWYV